MLHYRARQWHIGDVHPYYENGTLYLFYLKPNGVLRCDACFDDPKLGVVGGMALSVTRDFVHWTERTVDQYVMNIVRIGDRYYSCVGDRPGTSFIKSGDLMHWTPCLEYSFTLDTAAFPGGARDIACFWDQDAKTMRVTANAYVKNEDRGIGKGLHGGILLGDLADKGGVSAQRLLLPLDNQGRALRHCKEPECNQAIYLGDRWYILASLARQTAHWVGAPSYWIGSPRIAIDEQEWREKEALLLDGEDLCAAQLTSDGAGGAWLFGWIPLQYDGQEWGGDVNLPRRVYPLPDGRLGVKLDSDYAERIRGDEYACSAVMTACPEGYQALAPLRMTEFGVCARFDPGAEVQGIVADADNGIRAVVDRKALKMTIVSCGGGRAPYVFSALPLGEDILNEPLDLHVIFDGDIVEVFLNDRYALCARVNVKNRETLTGAFADKADCLESLSVYALAAEAAVRHA